MNYRGQQNMNQQKLAAFLLRTGLAVVFLYAAVSAFLDPVSWIGFIPVWLRAVIPEQIFLFLYNLFQIALSFWLLSGKKTFAAAMVSAATLVLIVLVNITALDLVFRDVAILFAAIALAALSNEHTPRTGLSSREHNSKVKR